MSGSHPLDSVHTLEDLRRWAEPGVWLAVIGYPIQHSISPQMQNAALQELALSEVSFADWKYGRFEIRPENLKTAIDFFQRAGFRGINLTVPHKVEVLPLVDEIDPEAERMGAVNTILFKNDVLYGYNTDGYGLLNALQEAFGWGLEGREVCVLGAGGASRAAISQCLSSGAAKVSIANRTTEKAEQLVARLRELGLEDAIQILQPEDVSRSVSPGTLIINATSLGLREDDPLPVEVSSLPENCFLYDMIYNPWETCFLKEGRARGYPVSNGLGMLVHQGARSLKIWTECEVNARTMESAALQSMRR